VVGWVINVVLGGGGGGGDAQWLVQHIVVEGVVGGEVDSMGF